MTSLFHRRLRELSFPGPLRLPSVNELIAFDADITARYRPGRARHRDREAYIRARVLSIARSSAQEWYADEVASAEDAINARLGKPDRCYDGIYHDLTAHVKLQIGAKTREAAERDREDRARIDRLKFLKLALYSDPSLLIIEHAEKSKKPVPEENFEAYWRFSDRLQSRDRWWSPLMAAWNAMAAETKSEASVDYSMRVLLAAIRRVDARLADQDGLPKEVDIRKLSNGTG